MKIFVMQTLQPIVICTTSVECAIPFMKAYEQYVEGKKIIELDLNDPLVNMIIRNL